MYEPTQLYANSGSTNIAVSGGCACGKVRLTVKGIPVGRYYCHCRACQKAHSSPYVAFALFSNDAIKWTSGQSSLLKIDGLDEPQSETHRYTCGDCGTRLYKEEDNAISLCVAIFDNPRGLPKEYEPTMHYFYKEKVRSVRDGLQKFANLPRFAGGTGESLEE